MYRNTSRVASEASSLRLDRLIEILFSSDCPVKEGAGFKLTLSGTSKALIAELSVS